MRHRTRPRACLARGLTAVFLLLAGSPVAFAQPQSDAGTGGTRAAHGAWSLLCGPPVGRVSDDCALVQETRLAERPDVTISAIVMKMQRPADMRVLRLRTPLGVLLDSGVELEIDGRAVGQLPFNRCYSEGCYVEVPLGPELLADLRAGSQVRLGMREFEAPARVYLPLDLSGFGEGYDALP